MTLYTLGYSGWRIEDIEKVLEDLDAIVVDVRMVPRSRAPMWNSGALARRFGDRYVWLREFGNRNYKGTVDNIEIIDFTAGEARLRMLAAGGRPVALLCGCPDASVCHRKVLAERLAQMWKVDVVHLSPPPKPRHSSQPTLFD